MTNPPELLYFGFLAGFCLFLIAKVSVIKTGKLTSFGWGEMNTKMKRLYFAGYTVMILSGIAAMAVYLKN